MEDKRVKVENMPIDIWWKQAKSNRNNKMVDRFDYDGLSDYFYRVINRDGYIKAWKV